MADLPSGTVTFLLTDIERSTHLWEQHPDVMRQALLRHDAIFAEGVVAHGGVLVRSRGEGDSFFAVFRRAIDAVCAAGALQRTLHVEAWPASTPLLVRMAVHTGEADLRDGQYYGTVVNRSARLRAIAHGGQVLLSLATTEMVRDGLPEGVGLRPQGVHRLRDLSRPEQVFQLVWPGLPVEFPPLASLDAQPNNLPIQLTSFVDRQEELAELKELLGAPFTGGSRLVTLIGPGGSGKTRLALEAGASMMADFPDGVWFVDLAPLADPALLPQTVATTLGVREEQSRPLAETVAHHLRQKQALMLLDNCERLVAPCASLASALLVACPSLRILATSREVLGVTGEVVRRVPSMSVPGPNAWAAGGPALERLAQAPAVRLFVERAAAVASGFAIAPEQFPVVAQICHRLDGLPLAIELAAAWTRVLPPQALLDRLRASGGLPMLPSGPRDAPERHRTLRAAIAWSYDLLSESERALLRLLSVFSGGFTLGAAEAVWCGTGGWDAAGADVLNLLTSLEAKSLAGPDPAALSEARFELLETIRAFAHEQLVAGGEVDAATRAHADHFLVYAANDDLRYGAREPAWIDALERDLDNFRAALHWLEANGRYADALRLAARLVHVWSARGYVSEGAAHLQRLLDRPENAAPTQTRAHCLFYAGVLARYRGDLDLSRRLQEEHLAVARSVGDRVGVAYATNYLALLARQISDYPAALARQEEALAAFRALGHDTGVSGALDQLAQVHRAVGNHDAAQRLQEESLVIRRRIGHIWGVAWSLVHLAELAIDRGHHEVAAAQVREAREAIRPLGTRTILMGILECCTALAAAAGQPERALRLSAAAALRAATGLGAAGDGSPARGVSERVAALLPPAAAAAAAADGRTMTLEAALDLAFAAEPAPATPPTAATLPALAAGGGTEITRREREVAALVASGLTNRAIAARMVITERTAANHVEHILAKLGLRNRAQITAWAIEHGLGRAQASGDLEPLGTTVRGH